MKKLISLFSLITAIVIAVCVTPNKVKAEENTWYTEAANNAGNPVLLEKDQYFEGISINSHLISDLTFMEIPFEEFISGNLKEVQIITFTEAFYTIDGETSEEIVMYIYYPDKYNGDNKSIMTTIDFISQECLVGSGFIDCLSSTDADSTYDTTWSKVSSYGNITKYSFSKVRIGKTNFSITKWLLNEYITGQEATELKTIFKANVSKFTRTISGTITFYNDGSEDFFKNQEFQFISSKENYHNVSEIMRLTETQATRQHTNSCISYNENTVRVDGEVKRFRYNTDDLNDPKYDFLRVTYDTEYTDIFYLFFNVYDSISGEKWGQEKSLKSVKLEYSSAMVNKEITAVLDGDKLLYYHSGKYKIDIQDSTGDIVCSQSSPEKDIDNSTLDKQISQVYESMIETSIKNSYNIWQEQIVTPDEYELLYLDNNKFDTFLDFLTQRYNQRKVTYLTLFELNGDKFKNLVDSTKDFSNHIIESYEYGLIFGNPSGYPASIRTINNSGWYSHENVITEVYNLLYLKGLLEIVYEEDGVVYRAVVSENNIDHSDVSGNIGQDDDIWEDEKGPDKIKDDDTNWFLKLIRKIVAFFENLPKWWKDNKTAVIGFVIAAGIIVACIFLWRFLSPIITAAAAKKAIDDSNKKKEE